jgi:riboflavin biosynthesis pyrimidine reductase
MELILGQPVGALTDEQVVAAYPWPPGRRWVRAMMVTTLDGAAAGPDGLSGSISGDADRAVFAAVRRQADAVLIGAGTLRAERYKPMRAKEEDAEARREQGQAAAPRLVIVSGSLELPWSDPVFSESTVPPLILTGSNADPAALARVPETCEVVTLAGDTLNAVAILDAMEERGLRRIVCEGGPTLLHNLVAAELLDEADITVSPVFTGTNLSPHTPGLREVAEFELAQVLTADGFLMARYLCASKA